MDEKEQKGFDDLLKQNPEAQAEVEQIRAIAGILQTELQNEPTTAMSDQQREQVMSAMDKAVVPFPNRRRRFFNNLAKVAAVLILVGGTAYVASTLGLGMKRSTQSSNLSNRITSSGAGSPVTVSAPPPVADSGLPVASPAPPLAKEELEQLGETDEPSGN